MTTPNPWADFLEEEPGTRAAYFSRRDQFGGRNRSQRQKNYFEESFTKMYDRYLGTLGLQVRQGEMPTKQWNPYLESLDWDQDYQENVPYSTRQAGIGGLVPRMRWDVLRGQ